MDYKEKLNLAKEALESGSYDKETIEYIFPELKESEDERIRKVLIDYFNRYKEQEECGVKTFYGIPTDNILAWLEKQKTIDVLDKEEREFADNVDSYRKDMDEFYKKGYNAGREAEKQHWLEKQDVQKSDKVEPKFKVGDWIITNKKHIWYVDETPETTSYLYRLINQYGNVEVADFEVVDKKARLWTIQDAKDGDVLFQDLMDGKTFIYGGINPDGAILYSFLINNSGEDVLPYNIGKLNTGIGYIEEHKNIIYPATKEQRDLLFSKMKEAGYMWDAEKKEPKKIEDKPLVIDEGKAEMDRNFTEMMLKDYTNQNPAWSEEDETALCDALWCCKQATSIAKDENDMGNIWYAEKWLMSLKERMKEE